MAMKKDVPKARSNWKQKPELIALAPKSGVVAPKPHAEGYRWPKMRKKGTPGDR